MKTKILTILRNSDKYISGQQLCESLGVSRTAVWKVINGLKEEGYEIESITNKGYRIMKYPDIVTKSEIESRLETHFAGRKVIYFDEIDSTNTCAKQIAEEQETDGVLIVAEQQLHGKGRRGREWSSPKGTGIWMSLIVKPNIKPQNASMLTLVTALAVTKSIKKLYHLDAFIKWPNDIVINGKKLCGILTEMSAQLDYINHIVIGIGINANTKEFLTDLKEIATSISIEYKKNIARAELIADILKEFEYYYSIFLEDENMNQLCEDYNKVLINRNKEVIISERNDSYTALALGINSFGELLVLVDKGTENECMKEIRSGEVSVRGMYGYV